MSTNKTNRYIFSAVLLAYFGLKDFDNFNLCYNGIAILASAYSFFLAYTEWKKNNSDERE